jgi:hypothetical protein
MERIGMAPGKKCFRYGDTLWEAEIQNDAVVREDYEVLEVGVFGTEAEAKHAAAQALWDQRKHLREVMYPALDKGHFLRRPMYRTANVFDFILGKRYAFDVT